MCHPEKNFIRLVGADVLLRLSWQCQDLDRPSVLAVIRKIQWLQKY